MTTKRVLDDNLTSPETCEPRSKLPRLIELEKLFNTDEFSDYTLAVGQKKFKVHKNILAVQSPVFNLLFTTLQCQEVFDVIKKFDETFFERFLRFFYSGQLRDDDNLVELLELASEFEFQALKSACEERIIESLDETTSLEDFKIGYWYTLEKLKRAAFREIQKTCPEIADYLFIEPKLVVKVVNAKRRHEASKSTQKLI